MRAVTRRGQTLRRCNMYADARELSQFRADLIAGGFDGQEAFNIIMTYFEAKLDTRQTEEGMVYLTSDQTERDGPGDG